MRLLLSTTSWSARHVLLVGFLLAPALAAQGQSMGSFTPEVQAALQEARRETVDRALSGNTVPLEGALDPNEYVIGPGDVFSIYVGGALPTQLDVTVAADGLLIVPDAGGFDAAGKTLAEVREAVREGLRRAYRNVDTNVTLARPRQFYVHVAGVVPRPGRHVVMPIARVEDALAAAMDDTSPLFVLRELRQAEVLTGERAYLPALRSIELRRHDGPVEIVDLWRYYTSGDLRFNPYVRDGDALYVPAFRDDLSAVSVEGEVANPGSYDYREGDTVLDLLAIAVGEASYDDLGPVRLLSRSGEARTLDAAALQSGQEANPRLAPGDHLLVAQRDIAAGTVGVAGYVQHPGSYPIRSGETTLQELVEMAGGLRPEAMLQGAYLERRGAPRPALFEPDQLTPFRKIPLEAEVNPALIETLIETEIGELTRNSELSFAGRQFYGRELLQPQRVSVNVAQVLSGDGPSVTLLDGDRLVVPRDPEAVLVIGHVQRPGYVPFRPGATAADYIAQAGGRGAAASGVFVREVGTGRIYEADGTTLQSGDYVFVDRLGVGDTPAIQSLVLQERSVEATESQRRIQYVQIGIGIAGTVATLVTAYIALRRNS